MVQYGKRGDGLEVRRYLGELHAARMSLAGMLSTQPITATCATRALVAGLSYSSPGMPPSLRLRTAFYLLRQRHALPNFALLKQRACLAAHVRWRQNWRKAALTNALIQWVNAKLP